MWKGFFGVFEGDIFAVERSEKGRRSEVVMYVLLDVKTNHADEVTGI